MQLIKKDTSLEELLNGFTIIENNKHIEIPPKTRPFSLLKVWDDSYVLLVPKYLRNHKNWFNEYKFKNIEDDGSIWEGDYVDGGKPCKVSHLNHIWDVLNTDLWIDHNESFIEEIEDWEIMKFYEFCNKKFVNKTVITTVKRNMGGLFIFWVPTIFLMYAFVAYPNEIGQNIILLIILLWAPIWFFWFIRDWMNEIQNNNWSPINKLATYWDFYKKEMNIEI